MSCATSLSTLPASAREDSAARGVWTRDLPRSLRSPGWRFEWAKRGIDVAVGGALLLIVMPVIAACAVWIACVGRCGVFYSQWRVGQGGYLFRIHKLRTMATNAERRQGARFAITDDPRILPGCHWMRRSHVDELPQLWNIVRGDMSLVGPRPERPEMFNELRGTAPRFERRLAARPGLTGLAQLRRGYTNDANGARTKLAWDLRYLRRRSIRGDLKLMLETLPKFWDRAAC